MTEELNTSKIAQLLTQSTRQLNPDTLSALSNARHKALQRQSAHEPVITLANNRWAHLLLAFSGSQWLSAGLLAALLVIGTNYWHQNQEQQIAELDLAILTDDLPIEVFVD